jgi:hypothetical protein
MSAGGSTKDWTSVNQTTLTTFTNSTSAPGVVYPVSSNAIPVQLHGIPGAVSYFVSGYTSPVSIGSGLTAGGELAVLRTDGDLVKGYCWVVATSSNGQVMFHGPHYHSSAHHFPSSNPVPIESLFGHVDKVKSGKP